MQINTREIKIIGVTGGIATGKSTVVSILEEYGGYVLDADKIYNEQIKKGKKSYNEIVSVFGKEILKDNGDLDKKKLSEIVFNDKDKLNLLNKITHKHVGDEIHNRVEELKEKFNSNENMNYKFIVLDVPIPVEYGFFDLVNVVFSVIANDDLRVERLMRRNNFSEEEANVRIKSQLSNREYAELADIVIVNEGDFEDLREQVESGLRSFLDYE